MLKRRQTCPIPEKLPFNAPPKLRILRRCNLILSDPAQNHRLSALASNYDLLAVRPVNEKSLQQACQTLECDLVSLDLTMRFDFHFKMKMLSQAVERGVNLEICYAPGIISTDSTARRNLIGNATQLIRATRGRGLIISSGATRVTGCRAPADVINLAAVWGLGQERGKEAMTKLARNTAVAAQLKRSSFRGVVNVVYGGEKPEPASTQGKGKPKDQNKRKAADVDGGPAQGVQGPKPFSKREQKRQRKAQLPAQNESAPAEAGI